jgi:hypothetical protein
VQEGVVKSVEKDLIDAGFKPFEVELGGLGVSILADFDDELGKEFAKSITCIHCTRHWQFWA